LALTVPFEDIAAGSLLRLQGAPRQQCAENEIGNNGFPQGVGKPLVASRHGDVAGEHDAAGQRYPARARTSLLPPKGKVAAAGGQLILMTSNAQEA